MLPLPLLQALLLFLAFTANTVKVSALVNCVEDYLVPETETCICGVTSTTCQVGQLCTNPTSDPSKYNTVNYHLPKKLVVLSRQKVHVVPMQQFVKQVSFVHVKKCGERMMKIIVLQMKARAGQLTLLAQRIPQLRLMAAR